MAAPEKAQATAAKPGTNSAPAAGVKRGPGHRAVDARDAIAELTERAQEISLEAGSKVAIAMKDVISAAAGLAGFAVESARDLVQFMVRRGQMTQDEADKLLREAETAQSKRPASERKRPTASEVTAKERAAARAKAAADREHAMAQHMMRAPIAHSTNAKKAAPKKKSAPRRAAKPAKAKAKKKGAKRR
jgi:polyhydroxyalkanoate synthesis regulator phasin